MSNESEEGVSNYDLGLCPHGCTDDEGCDEPGCNGGPEGFEGTSENTEGDDTEIVYNL